MNPLLAPFAFPRSVRTRKPPIKAPTKPMTISLSTPKPEPPRTNPASQSAMTPMTIHPMIAVSMPLPLLPGDTMEHGRSIRSRHSNICTNTLARASGAARARWSCDVPDASFGTASCPAHRPWRASRHRWGERCRQDDLGEAADRSVPTGCRRCSPRWYRAEQPGSCGGSLLSFRIMPASNCGIGTGGCGYSYAAR